jgi:hypothetical protein
MPIKEGVFRHALDLLTLPEKDLVSIGENRASIKDIAFARRLRFDRNLIGLGLARRITSGRLEADLAIKFYVDRKLPLSDLEPSKRIPRLLRLPEVSEGLPTDVEEIGGQRPQGFLSKVRPANPGDCVGNIRSAGGTFGCLVFRKSDRKHVYILSNSHVLAFCGKGKKRDLIVQPDLTHGGSRSDAIASLSDWVPFKTGKDSVNLCDAAIAAPLNIRSVSSEIAMIGIPKGVNSKVVRGMKVQKTGSATGHTLGVVKDVDYRFSLKYSRMLGLGSSVSFTNQVLCSRYSDDGDSGSVVCDMKTNVVGLHYAGSLSTSVFTPIGVVLKALDVQLVTWKI